MTEGAALSAQDKLIIETAERALCNGRDLFAWWKNKESIQGLRAFNLLRDEQPSVGMVGFYDTMDLCGKQTTVMGCLQRARFKRAGISSPDPETMELFCNTKFMRLCRVTHPVGLPGGFGYKALLYKLKGSDQYGVFSQSSEGPVVDLAEIGKRYDWAVLRIDIYDFVRSMPGMARFPKIASKFREVMYVAVHEDYFSQVQAPVPGALVEYRFGYSVLPYTVESSILGYGPARLTAAIKQFRFILFENGDLEIRINFISSPRSEKLLYLFGGFDPVYFSVRLANAITFNLFRLNQRAHDRADFFILGLHGRVHYNLIEGMRQIWEKQDWISAVRRAAEVRRYS